MSHNYYIGLILFGVHCIYLSLSMLVLSLMFGVTSRSFPGQSMHSPTEWLLSCGRTCMIGSLMNLGLSSRNLAWVPFTAGLRLSWITVTLAVGGALLETLSVPVAVVVGESWLAMECRLFDADFGSRFLLESSSATNGEERGIVDMITGCSWSLSLILSLGPIAHVAGRHCLSIHVVAMALPR